MSGLRRPTWQLWLLLTIPPVLVYANSLGNPFHYDDAHSIVENEHIRELANIPRYFVDPTLFASEPRFAMYRPLLLTTFALNYALGGYEVGGYHAVAILLHVACVVLVFAIARILLQGRGAAGIAALVFGLHPITTEPVNYVSSRSELLVAVFVLGGFYAFLKRRTPLRRRMPLQRRTPGESPPAAARADSGLLAVAGNQRTFALILVAYGAALLTKATAVALPAMLVAYDAIYHRRLLRVDRMLYGAMAAVSALYLWMMQSLLHKATLGAPVRTYSEQWWSQAKALVFYLQLLLVPTRLSVDQQFLISDSLIDPIAAAAAMLLVTALALGMRAGAGRRLFLFLLLWFLIALAPASLIPLNVLVNEHRLYIPLAAFAVAVGWGMDRLLCGIGDGHRVGVYIVAGLMMCYAFTTSARNQVWGGARTLWADAAAKAPLMARPHFFLAEDFAAAGARASAIEAYQTGLARDSTFTTGYVRLAEIHVERGDYEGAETAYLRAVEIEPENGELWGYLGAHYRARASGTQIPSERATWWQRSLQAYERAVSLSPQGLALLNNLGNTYQELGRWHDALRCHQTAARLAPEDAQSLLNLGNDYQKLSDLDAARQAYSRAVVAAPDYAAAWFSLALVREAAADTAGALQAYDRAARLDGGYAQSVRQRLLQLRRNAHE